MKLTHVIISGRVQGVYFRDYTKQQAVRLNLTGWVRNLPDTTVEAVFQGREHDIDSMLSRLKQGSPGSKVAAVQVEQLDSAENFSDFTIRN